MSKLLVRRLYKTLPTTPAAAFEQGWLVQLMCSHCMVGRELKITQDGRLARYWSSDFEDIFQHVRFKCSCGKHACAMRIARPTNSGGEVLLQLGGRGDYHG